MSDFFRLVPLAIALILAPELAFADGMISGRYTLRTLPGSQLDFREMYLAEDTGKTTGFFDNPFTRPAANNPDGNPTCRFYLSSSTAGDGDIRLETWYPDKRTGKIEAGSPIVLQQKSGKWVVTVTGALPNCDVPSIETGDFLTLDAPKPWKSIGYVNKSKTFLYSQPGDANRTNAYLVRSDPVAVLQSTGEWVHINYLGRGANLLRWLRRSDLVQR